MQEKNLKKVIKNINAPVLLIAAGVFLMFLSASHWYLEYQSLSLNKELIAEHTLNLNDIQSMPNHIYIEWFVDTNIEENILVDNKWTISENEASYLSNSASPGENGNIIIYGHNKRSILGNIRALKGNEVISITTNDGTVHDYVIETIVEVNPDEVDYLKPTGTETLTLYTCSGFMDKKRFIVQARPIDSNN